MKIHECTNKMNKSLMLLEAVNKNMWLLCEDPQNHLDHFEINLIISLMAKNMFDELETLKNITNNLSLLGDKLEDVM